MHSVTQDTDNQGHPLPLTGILPGVNEVKDGKGNVIGYKENVLLPMGRHFGQTGPGLNNGEEFVLDASYISLRGSGFQLCISPVLFRADALQGLYTKPDRQEPVLSRRAYAGHGHFSRIGSGYIGRLLRT